MRIYKPLNYYIFLKITTTFIILLLLLTSCAENKPTEPDDNNNNSLASITIDANGGTLETDEFKLEVPPGAFNFGVELNLYNTSRNSTDINSITKTYQIKGLPETYEKPIKIGIKYSGELKNESFISFEQILLFEETGDSLSTYNFIEIKDSSGFMWAQIPLRSDDLFSKTSSKEMVDPLDIFYFGGWSDFNSDLSTHFKVHVPSELSFKRIDLLNILEGNYSIIVDDIGLSFGNYWWGWPISVSAEERALVPDHLYYLHGLLRTQKYFNTFGKQWFEVDGHNLIQDNDQKLSIESGKDLTNLALSTYFDIDGKLFPQDSWVRRAIYTWAEEIFTKNHDFVSPEKFQNNAMLPLEIGMAEKKWSKSLLNLDHGDGMSSVIKYLVDDKLKFGKEGLKKTLESIKAGGNPVTSLINNVHALKSEWWLDYFKNYIAGKIYNVPASVFIDNTNSFTTWNINNEADTLKEFEATSTGVGKLPDLSAQLFKVNLNYDDIDPSKNLLVDVEGDVNSDGFSTIIFGYKNEALEHLVQGYASESILEISNLKDSGYDQFLIVLVNSNGVPPYNGESNAYLKLRLEGNDLGNEQILESNGCVVWTYLNGHYKTDDGLGGISETDELTSFQSQLAFGSFNGNTFTGTYNNSTTVGDFVGNVTVILNDELNLLSSVTYSQQRTNVYESQTTIRNTEVKGINIPISTNQNIFQVIGTQACNHLSKVTYKSTTSNASAEFVKTLENHDCNEYSYIKVIFSKE